MPIKSPVDMEPLTISLAPNQEITSVQPYMQNCIRGAFQINSFSALVKSE